MGWTNGEETLSNVETREDAPGELSVHQLDESPSRTAIIAGARECIAQFGVRKTTVTDIARAAGVSRGTVYRHFEGKAHVLSAAAQIASQQFYQGMARAMADGETLADQLALAAAFVRQSRQQADAEQRSDPDDVSVLLTRYSQHLLVECVEFLTPYIKRARDRGEVRSDLDVASAGEWFARMLFSLYSTPASTIDLDSPGAVFRFVKDFCVRGFLDDRGTLGEMPHWGEVVMARTGQRAAQ